MSGFSVIQVFAERNRQNKKMMSEQKKNRS